MACSLGGDGLDEHLDVNRQLWDSWVPHHLTSEFYDLEGFRAGDTSLDRVELAAVGDVRGVRLLHLQCHFGKDTISLARMGAQATGVDFSPRAIEAARGLAAEFAVDATFVESDIASLPDRLDGEFDLVFTSNGVIGWLPDLRRWGQVIAHFLAPGGRFVMVEGHPVMWLFDDEVTDERLVPRYPYFHRDEPLVLRYSGSYAVPDAPVDSEEHVWVHSVSDVLMALIEAGLTITSFEEHSTVAWRAFPFLQQGDDGLWRLPAHIDGEIPLSMTVTATKPR